MYTCIISHYHTALCFLSCDALHRAPWPRDGHDLGVCTWGGEPEGVEASEGVPHLRTQGAARQAENDRGGNEWVPPICQWLTNRCMCIDFLVSRYSEHGWHNGILNLLMHTLFTYTDTSDHKTHQMQLKHWLCCEANSWLVVRGPNSWNLAFDDVFMKPFPGW